MIRTLCEIAGLSLLAFSLTAGIAVAEGKYADKLKEALEASARGECPTDLMSALLVDACEQNQPQMGEKLESLGQIKSLKYRGMQESQFGPAEVYRVSFERGSMVWMVNAGTDGKLVTLWSPG